MKPTLFALTALGALAPSVPSLRLRPSELVARTQVAPWSGRHRPIVRAGPSVGDEVVFDRLSSGIVKVDHFSTDAIIKDLRIEVGSRIKIEVENAAHELKNNMPVDAEIIL